MEELDTNKIPVEEDSELTEPELVEKKEEVKEPESLTEEEHDEDLDISGDLEREDIESEKTRVIDVIETTELPVVNEELFETTTISKVDIDEMIAKKEIDKTGTIKKDDVVDINPDDPLNSIYGAGVYTGEKEEEVPRFSTYSFIGYALSILFVIVNIINFALVKKNYINDSNIIIFNILNYSSIGLIILTIILSIIAELEIVLKNKKGLLLIIFSGILLLVGTFLADLITKIIIK